MGKNNKILIVDDNANSLETLTDLLTEDGYCVVTAANGKSALELAVTENPDVVLIDTRLPDTNGYEVCRQIKALKHQPPKVIAYTAYTDAVNVTRAREVGADDFIAKTDDFANMRQAIQRLLTED